MADTPEEWDAIQGDLDRLEHWAQVNLMRFHKSKHMVLYLGLGNPHYQDKLGDEIFEHNPTEKDVEVLVDDQLYMSQ